MLCVAAVDLDWSELWALMCVVFQQISTQTLSFTRSNGILKWFSSDEKKIPFGFCQWHGNSTLLLSVAKAAAYGGANWFIVSTFLLSTLFRVGFTISILSHLVVEFVILMKANWCKQSEKIFGQRDDELKVETKVRNKKKFHFNSSPKKFHSIPRAVWPLMWCDTRAIQKIYKFGRSTRCERNSSLVESRQTMEECG